MEISWMDFYLREPIIHKGYWVTVHNIYWDEPKSMMLYWGEEVIRGIKQSAWKDGSSNKIPSTWKVTYWMELPPPKED